ncbi:hypothetical protein BGW80DRAFT_1354525, partial [Lactifluus volemus]
MRSSSPPHHLHRPLSVKLTIPPSTPDTGDRPYKCQHCGDQFARRSYQSFFFAYFLCIIPPAPLSLIPHHSHLVISSRDTLI